MRPTRAWIDWAAGSSAAAVLLAIGLSRTGWLSLMLALGCGFLLVGPLLAAGLYEASRRLERGEQPTIGQAIAAGPNARGQIGFFGFVLFLILFAWINVALLLFMLFFGDRTPPPPEFFVRDLLFTLPGLSLLVFGTLVGAVLAAIVFSISAVSVPLLMVENIDAVSAALASLKAVQVNTQAMALWAVLIAALMALGLVTLGIGLIVVFPWIGHATWHAYRDMIITD